MRHLPLRLLAVAFALMGLVVLADLEQRALRREADRGVAEAVAGYLSLAVPASPYGDYAADRLVSTVNRLHGSSFWHAGLQVTVGATPVIDDAEPPPRAARLPLPGPRGVDTVGTVAVWDTALGRGLPEVSWILAAATFLAAGLATTRRAGWLWPLLGMGLLLVAARALQRETERTADRVAQAMLEHAAPMAGLVLLDPRRPPSVLDRLGPRLEVREFPPGTEAGQLTWRTGSGGRVLTARLVHGNGAVVELALAPPLIGYRALRSGLIGVALVLVLAMLPPIRPRRPRRLPGGPDGARIPG